MLQKIALMMILRKAYYKIMDILAPNYFLNHWVEDGIHHLEAVDYPDFEKGVLQDHGYDDAQLLPEPLG